MLREKIVAAASRRMTVIVDETKLRGPIGSFCPVPVEVARFGWQATERKLTDAGAATLLRSVADGTPLVTDGGNYIIDCDFGTIADAPQLAAQLKQLVGVVEDRLVRRHRQPGHRGSGGGRGNSAPALTPGAANGALNGSRIRFFFRAGA